MTHPHRDGEALCSTRRNWAVLNRDLDFLLHLRSTWRRLHFRRGKNHDVIHIRPCWASHYEVAQFLEKIVRVVRSKKRRCLHTQPSRLVESFAICHSSRRVGRSVHTVSSH